MARHPQNNVEYFDRLLTLLEYAFELFPDVKWDLDSYTPSYSDSQNDPNNLNHDTSDNNVF